MGTRAVFDVPKFYLHEKLVAKMQPKCCLRAQRTARAASFSQEEADMAAAVMIGSATVLGAAAVPRSSASRTRSLRRDRGAVAARVSFKNIRSDATRDDDDAADARGAPAVVPGRRGTILGTVAAAVAGALPWTKDLGAAFAAGEAPYAPDAVTLQEMYFAATSKAAHPERWYPYWWACPLAPYGSKTTTFAEAVPEQVWCFDQLQGLLDVLVNVRMTVIALEGGGLWVHNPVAPTAELMAMMAPLVDQYGQGWHALPGGCQIGSHGYKWAIPALSSVEPCFDAQQ